LRLRAEPAEQPPRPSQPAFRHARPPRHPHRQRARADGPVGGAGGAAPSGRARLLPARHLARSRGNGGSRGAAERFGVMTQSPTAPPKAIVVMPAFNAAKTLWHTYEGIPRDVVSEVILVDDASSDDTVTLAQRLDIKVIKHPHNVGYGGNQKTCYMEALR